MERAALDRLRGFQQQTLDEKSRCQVPSKFLPRLLELCGPPDPKKGTKIVVAASLSGNIGVYPPSVYDSLLDLFNEESLQNEVMISLRQTLVFTYDEQYLDKQNRFRVPTLIAANAGMIDPAEVEGDEENEDSPKPARKAAKGTEAESEEAPAPKRKPSKIVVAGSDTYLELMSMKAWETSFNRIATNQTGLKDAAKHVRGLLAFLAGEQSGATRSGNGNGGH